MKQWTKENYFLSLERIDFLIWLTISVKRFAKWPEKCKYMRVVCKEMMYKYVNNIFLKATVIKINFIDPA